MRRILTVEVKEARNLTLVSGKGGTDPYAVVTLRDKISNEELYKERQCTEVEYGSVNPLWKKNSFEMGQFYNLGGCFPGKPSLPKVHIQVVHKSSFALSEVLLGVAHISLDDVDPNGNVETDKWVTLVKAGRMSEVSGDVRVTLKFNVPPNSDLNNDDIDVEEGEYDEANPLLSSTKSIPPNATVNELYIKAIRARNLKGMDKSMNPFSSASPTSDPLVTFEIKGYQKKSTKFIRKSCNPDWNEEFTWSPFLNSDLNVILTVEDHEAPPAISNTFIGRVIIPIREFDGGRKIVRWFALKSNKDQIDCDRGEVELEIVWRYNESVAAIVKANDDEEKRKASTITGRIVKGIGRGFKKVANIANSAVGYDNGEWDEDPDEDDFDDPDQDDHDNDNESVTEEFKKMKEEKRLLLDAEKKKVQDAKDELVKQISDIDIKPGDYQVMVHIIECRDLKAENWDGTSDPIVYIDCFGQKQHTKCVKSVTSCVYDELFIFQVKNVTKDSFAESVIRAAVYDVNSNPLMKKTMIGAYACDATQVYLSNKDHEIYRQWVPLMDDEDSEDVGVQGYMKMTIQIVGPGDKIKVHNELEDIAKENKMETDAGGDIGSLVLTTPVIAKNWEFLVVSVYRCEGLPVMDGKTAISNAKTDSFCQLQFAGGKPLRTKVKRVEGTGRSAMNPEFNCEIWCPVSSPSSTNMIKFSIWDWDESKNELIGNVTEKLNVIKRLPRSATRLQWYNMYGAHEFKSGDILSTDNLVKGVKFVGSVAKDPFSVGANEWGKIYNITPNIAPSFKGRALLRFRIESKCPDKYMDKGISPFLRPIKKLPSSKMPSSCDYYLKAVIFAGTELPTFGSVTTGKLRVRVSIGTHEIITTAVTPSKGGSCGWAQCIGDNAIIQLPANFEQLPDIFIYLVRDDSKPVCYKRISAVDPKTKALYGFNHEPEWHLLQEDKHINALATDVFPGSLLMKVGFGKVSDAKAVKDTWAASLAKVNTCKNYQVRVHIYSGKDFPPCDDNGLSDPFIKVLFDGQQRKTKVKRKTTFPSYYQTLVFDSMAIPDSENFAYAPQLSFRLYDYDDFSSSDYCGRFAFHLSECFVTCDVTAPLPDPKWKKFFKELPGDTQGELLVSVQLIPIELASKDILPLYPAMREAFVEIIVVGARNLAPYNFLAMQCPFLEFEIDIHGKKQVFTTKSSKIPDTASPNFLERIIIPTSLPENAIFAPCIQIRAKDKRLGGLMVPIVGSGSIDLSHKIPWCEDTYIPPTAPTYDSATDANAALRFLPLLKADPKNAAPASKSSTATAGKSGTVETQTQRNDGKDTGAGVFGDAGKDAAAPKDVFSDPDFDPEQGDQEPAYMTNRKVLVGDLEAELITSPFETYTLTRGQVNGVFGSTIKAVGLFKGFVRVMQDQDEPSHIPAKLLEDLFKPKKYKLRLYVLRAVSLTPMDVDIFQNPAKSDPYLKVTLGKTEFNDRENAVNDAIDVDLYKLIEIDAELPGASQLKIEIMDKDDFGSISDDLIGATTIDLEDRWFDKRWQELGEENMVVPNPFKKDLAKNLRWCTKPLERRSLYAPTNAAPQGALECWLDIMKPEVATAFPPDNVTLPPTQKFEVRVVIWKTRNIPSQDSFENMSDLFIKCWPEGCTQQETDTHWRCQHGKGSFNWRLVYEVELGPNTRAMKFPILHFQAWDRDIVKWNDCAGEASINIGQYYKRAYKRNMPVKLFEKKQGVALRRDMKQGNAKKDASAIDTSTGQSTTDSTTTAASPVANVGSHVDDYDSDDDELTVDQKNQIAARKAANFNRIEADVQRIGDEVPTTSNPLFGFISSGKGKSKATEGSSTEMVQKSITVADAAAAATAAVNANTAADARASNAAAATTTMNESTTAITTDSSSSDSAVVPVKAVTVTSKEDKEDEMREIVSTIKAITGLWPEDDMPESSWVPFTKHDHNNPGKASAMGELNFSVQIWPKDRALLMPAGAGRSEPNSNPFLPPPVGRLKFSLNPFTMGSALCGPKRCAQLSCCICCILFILFMIFCQPFINIAINMFFVVYQQAQQST